MALFARSFALGARSFPLGARSFALGAVVTWAGVAAASAVACTVKTSSVVASAASAASSLASTSGLFVESTATAGQVDPLGLGDARPRLSWRLVSGVDGAYSTAYEIEVATSEVALVEGRADLWKSGRVEALRAVAAVYDGVPLSSRQRAFWRVRVWDPERRPSAWSRTASFEMGLLRADDWRGVSFVGRPVAPVPPPRPVNTQPIQWIWGTPIPVEPDRLEDIDGANVIVDRRLVRRTFDVAAAMLQREAWLFVAACGVYEVRLNGQHVGRGTGAQPQIFDVRRFLTAGRNELVITSHQGDRRNVRGVAAQLVIEANGERSLELSTDASWQTDLAAEQGVAREQARPGGVASTRRPPKSAKSGLRQALVLGRFGEGPFARYGLEKLVQRHPEPPAYVRRTFRLDQPVVRARLYVTARGLYEPYVNGVRVGREHLAPGWTDYHTRISVRTHDVSSLVREGENAFGAILADGWYAGVIAWRRAGHAYGPYPLALAAKLVVEHPGGGETVVVSDANMRASAGSILRADLVDGEEHDLRREPTGWSAPGFDDAAWSSVVASPVSSEAKPALLPAVEPPIRVVEELRPMTMTEPSPGVYVFDFGQNLVGWARLRTEGPSGRQVQLRFGEALLPDGGLYTENLRAARAADAVVLSGRGGETFEPKFTFHGFRYLEVRGLAERPNLGSVTAVVAHNDLRATGQLETSSGFLNRLAKNIEWSQRSNFVAVPTDCPQRDERMGWMGDAQIFARTACFNRDVFGFFRKWMRDVVDAQRESGAFTDVSPYVETGDPLAQGAPGWADAGVLVPYAMYECYGDPTILAESYAAMRRYVAFVVGANPDLLWKNRRGNDYGDWIAVGARTDKEVLATAYLALSVATLAKAGRALGRVDEARADEALFERIRRAFLAAYVTNDGTVRGDTQTGYLVALRFGLVPAELRPKVEARLLAAVEREGRRLTTGFLGVRELLPGLTEAGRIDLAYELLFKESYPSWGFSLAHGATSIWERWDGWTPDKGFQSPSMNSFNHYSLGSVGQWMYEHVGGIGLDPNAPGYAHVLVHPTPGGGLTWARAALESSFGRTATAWRLEDGVFTLDAEIAVNQTATIRLPGEKEGQTVGSGRHRRTCRFDAARARCETPR